MRAQTAPYPSGLTRERLKMLTGYRKTSRDEYIRQLRAESHVDLDSDRLKAAQIGVKR